MYLCGSNGGYNVFDHTEKCTCVTVMLAMMY